MTTEYLNSTPRGCGTCRFRSAPRIGEDMCLKTVAKCNSVRNHAENNPEARLDCDINFSGWAPIRQNLRAALCASGCTISFGLNPMTEYIYFRADGFYFVRYKDNTEARMGAIQNPGTLRVENATTGEVVWEASEELP